MEQHLDNVLNNVIKVQGTVGVLIANRQGLCLGTAGQIHPNVAGIGVAISEQACKLKPEQPPPTVCLYSGNKRCIIQKDGEITAIIYKQGASAATAAATATATLSTIN